MRRATTEPELETWRDQARALLAAGVAPAEVAWTAPGGPGLLFDDAAPLPAGAPAPRVSARFVELARHAVLHREPGAHALLYRVLWRLTHGEPRLLDDAADPDVRALEVRARAVRHDAHRMTAFVRFREVAPGTFVAWHAPDHHVVALVAPFFRDRFAAMRWTILGPDRSVAWDGAALAFGPGVPRHAAPGADELEALWRTYYGATFNPARANPAAMRRHLPRRYWATMPETADVPELLAAASPRVEAMLDGASDAPARASLPPVRTLPVLREAARACTACELCGPATQTVFGEGPADAPLVLVGEQPGDEEDRAGHPFVGPAGGVLDDALARAGIPRARLYVTNAVKHFRFEPRGKIRLHQRPAVAHVRACQPWLRAELAAIRPRVVVGLGATAAHALLGSRFKLRERRGEVLPSPHADALLVTHHPAAILRAAPPDRAGYLDGLTTDLARAWALATAPA